MTLDSHWQWSRESHCAESVVVLHQAQLPQRAGNVRTPVMHTATWLLPIAVYPKAPHARGPPLLAISLSEYALSPLVYGTLRMYSRSRAGKTFPILETDCRHQHCSLAFSRFMRAVITQLFGAAPLIPLFGAFLHFWKRARNHSGGARTAAAKSVWYGYRHCSSAVPVHRSPSLRLLAFFGKESIINNRKHIAV